MKNTILIFLLFVASFSFAQSENFQDSTFTADSKTKKADRLFERMWYKEAALLYQVELNKVEDNDIRLLKRAGDSYFFNTDMENAYKYYDKLISDFYSEVEPEYIFRYSHALQGVGKYREAKRWMKEFSKRTKQEDKRAENFNQEQLTVENILELPSRFLIKNISTNTKFSDFGPMYYKDKLVYSSAVDSSNFHTRIYHWNEQPFLNMYLGKLNKIESDIKFIDEFSSELNTRYHEATLAFSPDETKVYFTRNNYQEELKRDKKGTNHLKLYSAELVKNDKGVTDWGNVKELPFNSENYSVGHPTISADGKLLYFTSDMPGSMGATDIFVVEILGDDTYSNPKNLGENINTAGREMFPYITEKSLYFASDGILGLGGLDVFESKLIDDSFGVGQNLGAPINSELDDFALIIKEDQNTGFVCSNRLSGKGDDDIYSFVRLEDVENPVCNQLIRGYVSNKVTGERIPEVLMVLYAEDGKEMEKTTTDVYGAYKFNTQLNCSTKFNVKASKTGYAPNEKPALTLNETGETIIALGLETVNQLIVEEDGLLKIKIGIIYFDLDKSFIRNDAAIELNKIVMLMNQYPNMVINIESHTDSRNSDNYNLDLSDRRANSTKEYIIEQGIDANRIENAKGFGETQLINKCSNGVTCTEIEHQLNRRSEFIIVKM